MNFLEELEWRGLVADATAGAAERFASAEPVVGYIGFDPTAPSLHVGSLIPVLGLARLQRAGHRPIAVVGGGTGLIGDPSGKSAERPLLDREQVEANVAGIRAQLERFLDFEGAHGARLVNNLDWLGRLTLLDFLRDTGKHFSMGALLAREGVRRRLDSEQGMSFTEFAYVLLQAHDFLELYDRYGCELQMGGSDQWGNIVAGCELIRRRRGARVYGIVFPLLTTASGAKFGKTEAGTVWLDPKRTSPYHFYQFWINAADDDAVRFLRYFTFLDRDTIDALAAEHAERPHERLAQRRLAEEVTRMVHGEEGLAAARRLTALLFGDAGVTASAAEILDALRDAPAGDVPAAELEGEGAPVAAVAVWVGAARSRGEARRLIKQGGLYLNNRRVVDADARVRSSDAIDGRVLLLRKGRKHWFVGRIVR